MLCNKYRDIKPARDFFAGHETLMYSSLSALPFNSLMLSTDSSVLSTSAAAAAAARGLAADLRLLAANNAKQGKESQEAQLMLTNPRDAFRDQSRSPNMAYHSIC